MASHEKGKKGPLTVAKGRPKIALVYDLLGVGEPGEMRPDDWDAEYEPERTIETLEGALRLLGCEPVLIGSAHDLLRQTNSLQGIDGALNIAEGYGTRNREAWAPVLLEMLKIPCLGSDALTLSLSLDKAWTKTIAAAAGVPTPPFLSVASTDELDRALLPGPFPLFVKPRWEGTAKGITPRSRAEDKRGLHEAVARVIGAYRQPAVVETFLPGPEYTVTVVGSAEGPRCLPVLQRALETTTGIGIHALERHAPGDYGRREWSHHVPGSLDAGLEAQMKELSLRIFTAMECRDFARIDFKLDGAGAPYFLEINTLPTFDPEGSFGILAELEGLSPEALLAEVFGCGLKRLGVPKGEESRA